MEEIFILVAEDDADDRFLLQAAFEENGFTDKLHFVENGVELIGYLNNLSANNDAVKMPRFILLVHRLMFPLRHLRSQLHTL
jgi:CheY-like chemotaxis protein